MNISFQKHLIYLPAFLMDMSTSSAILGMPFYASRLGASPLIIGIIASTSSLLYILFSRVFGKLSDRVSRKMVPQIACICFSILYFFIPLCKSLGQLAVLFPFTGLTLSAFWPPLEAWIGELADDRPLAKRVKMFNLSWTCGVMIGYATGGYIYELHYAIPFYFAGVFALCAAVVVAIQPGSLKRSQALEKLEERGTRGEAPRKAGSTKLSGVLDETMSNNPSLTIKYLHLSWTANFFSWFSLGATRYIFPKLINELKMAPRVFGLLMLVWSGTQALMFYILGTTKKWHHKSAPLIGFQMLGCIGFLIIWMTNLPRFWAPALMLFGIDSGMTYFSSIYYSLYGHSDLGNKSGWHESILSSGAFLGPFIGGALANYISLKSPYLFCAMMIIAGLMIQFIMLHVNKQQFRSAE